MHPIDDQPQPDRMPARLELLERACLEVAPLKIDLVTRTVEIVGRPRRIPLSGREFELLLQLVRKINIVQSRTELLRSVWNIDFATNATVVEVTMSRLRRKLQLPNLETVKDAGYLFRASRNDADKSVTRYRSPTY